MSSGKTGPVKYANINVSAATSNEIVAAVAEKQIRVLGMFVYAASAVTVTVEDEDGTDLIGPTALGDSGSGWVLPPHELGHQEAPTGKALHLLLSAAVQVGGCVIYQVTDSD